MIPKTRSNSRKIQETETKNQKRVKIQSIGKNSKSKSITKGKSQRKESKSIQKHSKSVIKQKHKQISIGKKYAIEREKQQKSVSRQASKSGSKYILSQFELLVEYEDKYMEKSGLKSRRVPQQKRTQQQKRMQHARKSLSKHKSAANKQSSRNKVYFEQEHQASSHYLKEDLSSYPEKMRVSDNKKSTLKSKKGKYPANQPSQESEENERGQQVEYSGRDFAVILQKRDEYREKNPMKLPDYSESSSEQSTHQRFSPPLRHVLKDIISNQSQLTQSNCQILTMMFSPDQKYIDPLRLSRKQYIKLLVAVENCTPPSIYQETTWGPEDLKILERKIEFNKRMKGKIVPWILPEVGKEKSQVVKGRDVRGWRNEKNEEINMKLKGDDSGWGDEEIGWNDSKNKEEKQMQYNQPRRWQHKHKQQQQQENSVQQRPQKSPQPPQQQQPPNYPPLDHQPQDTPLTCANRAIQDENFENYYIQGNNYVFKHLPTDHCTRKNFQSYQSFVSSNYSKFDYLSRFYYKNLDQNKLFFSNSAQFDKYYSQYLVDYCWLIEPMIKDIIEDDWKEKFNQGWEQYDPKVGVNTYQQRHGGHGKGFLKQPDNSAYQMIKEKDWIRMADKLLQQSDDQEQREKEKKERNKNTKKKKHPQLIPEIVKEKQQNQPQPQTQRQLQRQLQQEQYIQPYQQPQHQSNHKSNYKSNQKPNQKPNHQTNHKKSLEPNHQLQQQQNHQQYNLQNRKSDHQQNHLPQNQPLEDKYHTPQHQLRNFPVTSSNSNQQLVVESALQQIQKILVHTQPKPVRRQRRPHMIKVRNYILEQRRDQRKQNIMKENSQCDSRSVEASFTVSNQKLQMSHLETGSEKELGDEKEQQI